MVVGAFFITGENMLEDDDTICYPTRKEIQERKKRIRRGQPPDKDIQVNDIFLNDSYSSPTSLTLQDVKELTGQ